MALLEIVMEGDPILRQKASKIRTVDAGLRKLAADMHETMLEAPGVGLAAPQIGLPIRMLVMHLPENYEREGTPEVTMSLVNPEILKSRGRVLGYEGCLSIPGWTGEVPRSESITVRAMGLDNRPMRFKADGWFARVLQHEIDHLDGILFLDRVEDKSTIREVDEQDVDAE